MFIANEQVFLMNKQKAVRLCLKVHYGQLRRATTGRQKSSPFLASSLSLTATELVEVQGLHSLFTCLRVINAKRKAKLQIHRSSCGLRHEDPT
jgi:hypothetical protein